MKVGLLLCDHVNPLFSDEFGDYPEMFQDFWPTLELEVFAVCDGQFPDTVGDCEAYIATGSSYSVYERIDWIERLKGFIREIHAAGKYYLGVCFGHQLLAEALGGKVLKSNRGWSIGVHTFSILKKEAWMLPYQDTLNLLMMCQDQVEVLPPGGVLLGSTPNCPMGMFRVGTKLLGIQAHPEFSKAYDQVLMESRVDRMGEAIVRQGIASLAQPLDASLFGEWAIRFFAAAKYENLQ
ncbi:MAG: hypothetical protein R2828_22905 [Saprospiraceae bacterium]